jgi:rSAM/selenodomain-associated transferase 1
VVNQSIIESGCAETDPLQAAPTQKTSKGCIGIFARAAHLGQVKTRIAAELGDEAALLIYQQLLQGTLERAAQVEATRYLWATDTDCGYLRFLAAQYGCELRLQADGDLGERMRTAMEWMLGQHEHAVLVGSDCPMLTPDRLEKSFVALERADVVMAPAEDGGFVLIASSHKMKSCWGDQSIFRGVRWSTENTLNDTLNCLHDAYAQVTILDRLWDVDTAADVSRAIQAGLLQWPGKGLEE